MRLLRPVGRYIFRDALRERVSVGALFIGLGLTAGGIYALAVGQRGVAFLTLFGGLFGTITAIWPLVRRHAGRN